jgi:hypothetical protein
MHVRARSSQAIATVMPCGRAAGAGENQDVVLMLRGTGPLDLHSRVGHASRMRARTFALVLWRVGE